MATGTRRVDTKDNTRAKHWISAPQEAAPISSSTTHTSRKEPSWQHRTVHLTGGEWRLHRQAKGTVMTSHDEARVGRESAQLQPKSQFYSR